MKPRLHANLFLSFSLLCLSFIARFISLPAYGQASTDQATVSADQMLNDASRQQLESLVNQRNSFQLEVNKSEQADDNYRIYAQQRIEALLKAQSSHSLSKEKQGELYALQHWIDQDVRIRSQDQARIQELNQQIAAMQASSTQAIRAMRSDIHNMRVDADAQAANQKFQQQMAVNYFNELQSEMGAVSWGRPPTDGTFNTTSGALNRTFGGGGGQGGYGGYALRGYNY
jgi:hypothetical protein